jgi:hypothetical protein
VRSRRCSAGGNLSTAVIDNASFPSRRHSLKLRSPIRMASACAAIRAANVLDAQDGDGAAGIWFQCSNRARSLLRGAEFVQSGTRTPGHADAACIVLPGVR